MRHVLAVKEHPPVLDRRRAVCAGHERIAEIDKANLSRTGHVKAAAPLMPKVSPANVVEEETLPGIVRLTKPRHTPGPTDGENVIPESLCERTWVMVEL